MFDEHRFGNDGTEAARPCEPDDGDDQMKEKDDDIAHPAMVSKPEKTPNWTNSVIRHGHLRRQPSFTRMDIRATASIIHGIGPQKNMANIPSGLTSFSSSAFGPCCATRRWASVLERPILRSTSSCFRASGNRHVFEIDLSFNHS